MEKNTSGIRSRKCSYGIWKYVSDKHQDSENSSFIFSGIHTGFFYKLFTEAEQSGKIVFEESPEQNIYFLCMDDLAELLYKVYDNWGKEYCLNVPDCFGQSFSDLEKEIRKTIPGRLDVSYQNSGQIYKVQPDDQIIRYEYGWFPKISVFEDNSRDVSGV